jgi:opacity protein-like surface antigen
MIKTGTIRVWIGAMLLCAMVWTPCPSAWADGGPLSIGLRAVDYVPTDGKGTWKGGLQARLQLPLFFAVEGSVDYRDDKFGATDAHDYPALVSVLLYPLPKIVMVQPFFLVGGGYYHTTVDGPNGFTGTQNRFGPHVGAGVDFDLNSNWFLDATYRYVWLSDLHTVNDQGAAQNERDRGHMITIGLNCRI